MAENKPLVVAFVGIEGIGKTWTSSFFTKKYQTFMAIEYGNWYIKNVLHHYYNPKTNHFFTTKKDFFLIVQQQQLIWEKTLAQAAEKKVCFFDTDLIYTKYFIDKQFYSWNWIDLFLSKQPIDLFIFIDSSKVKTKPINWLNPKNASREKTKLLTYYQKFTDKKMIVVQESNYQKRIWKIDRIITNFLAKNAP